MGVCVYQDWGTATENDPYEGVCVYQDWGTATENDPYEGVCLSGFGHCHRGMQKKKKRI